jgi:hypothetical protein
LFCIASKDPASLQSSDRNSCANAKRREKPAAIVLLAPKTTFGFVGTQMKLCCRLSTVSETNKTSLRAQSLSRTFTDLDFGLLRVKFVAEKIYQLVCI